MNTELVNALIKFISALPNQTERDVEEFFSKLKPEAEQIGGSSPIDILQNNPDFGIEFIQAATACPAFRVMLAACFMSSMEQIIGRTIV